MINAVHLLRYSRDPVADRKFFRDVLGWPWVEESATPGWLIFKLPPAEIGVHPTDDPPSTELMLMCDDLEATVTELEAKGVEFTVPVTAEQYGRVTAFRLPGGGDIALYQPTHETAHDL